MNNDLLPSDITRGPLMDRKRIDPYSEPPNRMRAPSLLVDVLRRVVGHWRDSGYPGVTPTTKRLLEYWFYEDHLDQKGMPFKYYFAQQEAAETVIYIHEVLKARRLQELVNRLSAEYPILADFPVNPDRDIYTRWAIKMATGTGKTKVMSLLAAWSILNSIRHPETGLASHVLIIAPNIIVFERLWKDFADNKLFFEDPVLPPALMKYWTVQITRQDEALPPAGPTITITNIQRLYPPKEGKAPKSPSQGLIGQKPPKNVLEKEASLFERLTQYDNLLIINDEAHHVHGGYRPKKQVDSSELVELSEEEAWNMSRQGVITWLRTILDLNDFNPEQPFDVEAILNPVNRPRGSRVVMQLDFSATPKSSKGHLFQHIVSDFPLRDAMRARIVKWPIKIEIANAKERDTDDPIVQFGDYLEGAIRRLEDYEKLHARTGKQPVLFVMAENTDKADKIADWLKDILGKDKVLVIHTKNDGSLPGKAKDLDKLRNLAHNIDERNDYRAIVSVLMLREGWDVKNVCVIAGLRAYSAPANILPEQTIGRGLRLMYPRGVVDEENVDVIGTPNFMEFVDKLRTEDVELETMDEVEARKRMGKTIAVEPERVDKYDIAIPVFTGSINIKIENLEALADMMEAPEEPFDIPEKVNSEENRRLMRGFYAGTDEVAFEEEFWVNLRTTLTSIVYHHARSLVREVGIGGALGIVAEQLEKYIREKVFPDWPDDPEEERRFIYRCLQSDFKEFIFSKAKPTISKLVYEQKKTEEVVGFAKLSNMEALIWHGEVYPSKKTVLTLVPYDSELERDFMTFLDDSDDVERWGRILRHIFYLEYLDHEGRVRHYVPDFVVRTTDGNYYLIETKGLETPNVPNKDARAKRWVESVNKLGLGHWEYLKITQDFWGRHYFNNFNALLESIQQNKSPEN